MANNLLELITALAKKAGEDMADPKFVDILSNQNLKDITIPDWFYNAVDNKLLSVEAAKANHPEIAKVYRALNLGVIDEKIDALLDGINDETLTTSIKGDRNTYTKLDTIMSYLNDKSKKASASTGDNKEYEAQLEALKRQVSDLAKVNKTLEAEKTELSKTKDAEKVTLIKQFSLRNKLSGRKTLYDDLAADERNTLLEMRLNKWLNDKDAVINSDETGQLTLAKKDGSTFLLDNHTTPSFDEVLDIVYSDLAPKSNPEQPNRGASIDTSSAGNNAAKNSFNERIKAANKQALESLEGQ